VKSFWNRPEGKVGVIVLFTSIIAGLYGLSLALPWMIAFATDMLHLAIEGIALFGVLYTVTNKTFRNICSNVFQMSMRWMTGMVIEIDPIGILKNNLDRMRDRAEGLDKAIAGVNGAKKRLEMQIQTNADSIRHDNALCSQIDSKMQRTQDPLEQQRLILQKKTYLADAGRKMASNERFNKILAQCTKMYQMLTRWQQLAEFNIENTDAEIKNAQAERDTILASYKGLGFARKLIKGDPEELKMVNETLEYLARDNAEKLGAMEDFSRYSEHFLENMDLEQGANADEAEKKLAEYEKKLMSTAGDQVQRKFRSEETQAQNQAAAGSYLDQVQ
jgi:hypothetical protein